MSVVVHLAGFLGALTENAVLSALYSVLDIPLAALTLAVAVTLYDDLRALFWARTAACWWALLCSCFLLYGFYYRRQVANRNQSNNKNKKSTD